MPARECRAVKPESQGSGHGSWVDTLGNWFSEDTAPVRALTREGLRIDLADVPMLRAAEWVVEEGWSHSDLGRLGSEPPEPSKPLQAVVCLGTLFARDALTLYGRAYRWLAPGGVLFIADFFSDEPQEHGLAGCPIRSQMLALAFRAGFSLMAERATRLTWELPHRERESLATGTVLVFRRPIDPGRWRVTYQEPARLGQARSLFRDVFGHEISEEFWDWKYGEGRGQGALVLNGERVVGHYGVQTRRVLISGKPIRAAQVADVMVEPGERGVLTRKGPFFQAAASMAESCAGFGSKHLIGYGFPNERHHRLAERLGLYREVERITQLTWPASPDGANRWVIQDLASFKPRRARRTVNRLWDAMAADLGDMIVAVRDFDWLQHRYLEHPDHSYQVLVVRQRWSWRLMGLAVLREHESAVELMDLIGPLKRMRGVVQAMRGYAANLGRPELFCWITSGKAGRLLSDDARETDPDVCIPTSVHTPGPNPEGLRGRWWLMSGDTDFR